MINEQVMTIWLNDARNFLLKKISYIPEIGIILGSGLGKLAELVEDAVVIPYSGIPHFPVSTVTGHSGKLIVGTLGDRKVMVLQGRFHYYEGYEMHEVTFPVRLMQTIGMKGLVVTNAAGGINSDYRPGDLIVIKDHINLMGSSPLRGANLSNLGPRFPDLSEAYDGKWRELALSLMKEYGLNPWQGVYAALSGPSYETPSEIRYLRTIGADLVGMSTVPEVIVANHGGMKVLGISCVTNMAAGILKQKLDHQEVLATADRIEETFLRYMRQLIALLD
ncbi:MULTISPECIES: purine-nucleoside phosphorylase [unclassified Dehalobacter]|uniref:purine-nucleoside phosphorylase n=1 Tax=unclassified Dehalobacter TaxID=2635733 RepID=UPI000E6BB432|nr:MULTISPECIES: purine-nucleoside phosphorylase [unclassified Dehalobacter]RJE48409.1 purine-nucleoside phosphorylase [Dehalobacter sp. MCB1]TCX50478.1 purine-nucleoside phosphorylase [Dehalobacter sp. 14DCB1]TCX52282.1 purine-nucleoside phosphorylase [Dehalobacter sp. 12DCB1]